MLSISLSCCIALAKNSSTMLSRRGESKHLCLVPCLWESNNCAQMQVRLQFTRFFFLFWCLPLLIDCSGICILISTYLYIFQFSPHNLFLVSYYYGWEKRPDIISIFLNLCFMVLNMIYLKDCSMCI